jgi:hypothetical protein
VSSSARIARNWVGAAEIEAAIDVRDGPCTLSATNLMGQLWAKIAYQHFLQ